MRLICVSTDKGLAGALNTNIQRLLAHTFRDWAQEGKKVEATAIGNKGLGFLNAKTHVLIDTHWFQRSRFTRTVRALDFVSGAGSALAGMISPPNSALIEFFRSRPAIMCVPMRCE